VWHKLRCCPGICLERLGKLVCDIRCSLYEVLDKSWPAGWHGTKIFCCDT